MSPSSNKHAAPAAPPPRAVAAPASAAVPPSAPSFARAAAGPAPVSDRVPAPGPPRATGPAIGRIPVIDVSPAIEAGRWPTKAVVGEVVPVEATVFREGHDAFRATAVLVAPDGTEHERVTMVDVSPGLDRWRGEVVPDATGEWGVRVEGWSDPYGTWRHNAEVKVPAGIDVDLMLDEGRALLAEAAGRTGLDPDDAAVLERAASALGDAGQDPLVRLAAGTDEAVSAALARRPLRDLVSTSPTYPLVVDRPLALAGAWYEIFPRSEGATYDRATATWTSGTLRTAAERLPAIADLGFDVVYLTPVHPIGTTFRKGRNNTLEARPGDPGSPYAIGSVDGGHDAVHPDLGTFEDFDAFVARARELDLEVALDLALQCSPDHPWVTEHPEWFVTRVDGTIAYAENPPKKYQDIYPLSFDTDPEGLYNEILRVVQLWISHGVTLFRVDNPHTKPLDFWERLLAAVRASNPEVIFLAEAFTRPAMMHTLAKIGFHQSYTYFTWRNTKEELEEYLTEVAGPAAAYMRPSFWPTTHDILPPYLQSGGVKAFHVRAVLAALSAPTWGVYTGYELVENVPRPGVEEQIDNEKYEYRPRDWSQAAHYGVSDLIARLNTIRRAHPALRQLRNLLVHPTTDENVLAFSHHLAATHSPTGVADTVITVVNLDPHAGHAAVVHLDVDRLGLGGVETFVVYDELTGESWAWGAEPYVELHPDQRVAHVLHVRRP